MSVFRVEKNKGYRKNGCNVPAEIDSRCWYDCGRRCCRRYGGRYYYLTAGSAVQYLAVIIFAMMVFFDFSFLICYFCVNALVDLPLGVMLANIARYALLTIPANLGLLLAAVLLGVLLCIKPFLLTLLPLLLCLYGWLCVLSHKNKILFYMTSNE
jgi:hypothetical protein